jgi:hypothetical protein
MAVTLASLSLAAAVNCTGELTEAPFAGEQITTVLSTVAAQVCACAGLVARNAAEHATAMISRLRRNAAFWTLGGRWNEKR